MNKELRDWTRGINESNENCIERMRNNTLSEKDRADHSMMLVDLAQAFRADSEYGTDPVMQDIAGRILDCYSALRNDNADLLESKSDEIRQLVAHGEILVTAEDRKRFQAREDGRTYIDFLPLMPLEQYMQVIENLKALGAKYDAEAKQWYVEKDWQPLEMNRAAEHAVAEEKTAGKPARAVESDHLEKENTERPTPQETAEGSNGHSGKDITPVELRLPYMSQDTFKTARAEIKAMGAKFNADKKVWYVERSAGEKAIVQIRDCLDRHDEGIYLKLPRTESKEDFNALVGQIKKNGARYNPDKKAWYITKETDRSKFADYLPLDKPSVRDKLAHNKESTATGSQGKERAMEPRYKDNHERA